MSCHACQEAEATEFRDCGHRLCPACLVLLDGGCVGKQCDNINSLHVRLSAGDWGKIEAVYQKDVDEKEVEAVVVIGELVKEYETKLAALRQKREQEIIDISQHIKRVTASLMQEESLSEPPEEVSASYQKLVDLPTPTLILASENLMNFSGPAENTFRDQSCLRCPIINYEGNRRSRLGYQFVLYEEGQHTGEFLGLQKVGGYTREVGCGASEYHDGYDAFDQIALELCGFRDDPEAFLFREAMDLDSGLFIVSPRKPKLVSVPLEDRESVIKTFTPVCRPVDVGYRLYGITVGQNPPREFLILYDLPGDPPLQGVIRKDPMGLMVTFDCKRTVLIQL